MEEEMMQQQLKIILLKERSEYLLGKVTELDEEPSILIEGCYQVMSDEEIIPFPAFTSQRDMFLTSECIMSILDPNPNLVELYNKK